MKNKHPVLRRFMRRKVSVVAAAVLILFVLIAILGPLVWQVDPLKQSVMKKYGPMTLLTVITVVGQGFISALAGAAVVERLFNIPGMGSLMVDSIEKRDYQVIQAITLLIAMLNVFINLIIDLIYGLADPRIRLD